ncbi:phosphoglycerate mutase-like protein [Xylaria sp. FL0064]|nr:phosphoglycerate mutase-like protein [Xylaria sp. FL0064]
MSPLIHVIRHAQALHNVHQDFSIHDPLLTELGHEQCRVAKTQLGNLRQIEMIFCSPLRRTIQTALALFPEYAEANKRIVLMPDLQEVGSTPSDTGSSREYLESKYGRVLDYSLLTSDWTDKSDDSNYSPQSAGKRAARTRLFIQAIAQKYADKEVNIVVVSHGNYLRLLTKDEKFFSNVERRTYAFNSTSGDRSETDLLETPNSISIRQGPPLRQLL